MTRHKQLPGYEEFERIARRIISRRQGNKRINTDPWNGSVVRWWLSNYTIESIDVKGIDPRTFQRRKGDRRSE